MGEFELIDRFFKRNQISAGAVPDSQASDSIALGIGDDCALLQPAPGMQLAVSTDLLVEGRHFFADVDPAALGHKALAVNLSDLAAMGAEPLGFTLALALPPERAADAAWLQGLANGLLALADAHRCPLVGGDTTAGPLALCLTIFGQLPPGQALRRDGARVGDDLWVSGTLGDAQLALQALRGERRLAPEPLAVARQRLERPTPRVALGLALRGVAHSAIDLSDGLAGDLGHILAASRLGAWLDAPVLSNLIAIQQDSTTADSLLDAATRLAAVLSGGDDYELLFSAPPAARAAVLAAGARCGLPVTRIGATQATPGLWLRHADGASVPVRVRSFDHFA